MQKFVLDHDSGTPLAPTLIQIFKVCNIIESQYLE